MQEPESSDKILDFENSPLNGSRTEAEWAESSLTQQRDGANFVKNELLFQKERLDSMFSKIDEYEKIAKGDLVQGGNSAMSKERAAELAVKYKENLNKDGFSKMIENAISFYNGRVNTYDEYSGGLASKVTGNGLENISLESLGLDNLPGDRAEMMDALDRAIAKLDDIAKSIENDFYKASGKTIAASDPYDAETRKGRMDLESAYIEMETMGKDAAISRKTLKMEGFPPDFAL